MKVNETPILSIEHLRAVSWRFQSFVGNLRINSDIIARICHDQRSDIEFKNVSHKAIQEIENLKLVGNIDMIDSYFGTFQRLNDKLKFVIDRLEDKSLTNNINIAKIEIENVFYYLNLYNSRYNEQRQNNDKATLTSPLNEIQTANKKKQPKDVWGLVSRYNFIKDLGALELLENMTNQTEKARAISQILGCNIDNAKKLKNGEYLTSEKEDDQLERKQLFELIKQNQINKKG
jgi:hypothetical protein